MKRLIAALLAVLMLCALPLSAGCGKKDNGPCQHEHLSEWKIDKYATCLEQGIRHKECLDCGAIVLTQSYHMGHQYVNGVCTVCGHVKYDEQYMKYEPCTLNGVEGYIVEDLKDCKCEKLNIPATYNGKPVLAIAAGAFKNRDTVTDVLIPKSVVSVGEEAFLNCTSLKTVAFAVDSACTTIGNYAFAGCPALVSFTVPERVTRLPNHMFDGDGALEDLLLHDGITAIGVDVFEGCTSLLTTQKNGLAYLGNGENRYFLLLNAVDKTADAFAPEPGLKIVGAAAFAGCRNLTSLTLPDGVVSLSDYAVSGCATLTTVTLPASLRTVGDYAFAGCTSLAAVDLPQTLFGIGNCAFSDCTALTTVVLPDSLRALGSAVFSNTGVTAAEVDGDGLLYLGSAANPRFALVGITNETVTDLTLHADTRLIAGHALAGCNTLASVTLPAGLVGIGPAVFANCGALVFVTASGEASVADRIEDIPVSVSPGTPAAWAQALTGTYLFRYWFLQ